jgi:HD-GYP domain-containing protein (c-di-GMP phosphodiesterase class II)
MLDARDARRHATVSTIYHGPGCDPGAFPTSHATWRSYVELLARRGAGNEPTVLIVDATMLERIAELRDLPDHVIIVAGDEASSTALGRRAHVSLVGVAGAAGRRQLLRAACRLSVAGLTVRRQRRVLLRTRRELHELNRIGMGLMLERDEDVLLRQILDHSKRFTESDAGSLLLLETDARGLRQMRLALCAADSVPEVRALTAPSIPVDDTTVIGRAAAIGQPVIIDDAHELPPDAGFDPDVDRQFAYRLRSMLIVPMIDHLDRLIGMLVLVNRKSDPAARITSTRDADRFVLRYTGRQLRLAHSLAGQAAVSIENARLYAQIERTLMSIVAGAVTAIDQRDPTTAGHSVRVAALTVALAEAVQREGRGAYQHVRFTREEMRELRLAALLHDIGKITVHEDVLLKAKKLPPVLGERVDARFDLIRRTLEVEYLRSRAQLLSSTPETRQEATRLEAEFAARLDEVRHFQDVVRAANEPTVQSESASPELQAIAGRRFERPDHTEMSYLTPDELHYLQIPRGTLNERERAEFESHVESTYQYLIGIPWTRDLKNLATYAYQHHERLDGTGYPRKLTGEDIPLQSRLITIADIFDALTAADRPYKPAVPPEKALEMLQVEANAGGLDSELVRIMTDSRIYLKVVDEDWRHL